MDWRDMIVDEPLYADWLLETMPIGELPFRFCQLLRDGGYTVPEGMEETLYRAPEIGRAHV